jgi:hypothetical protein
MSRPTYESAADRLNEIDVAERICEAQPLTYHKLPKAYSADFVFFHVDRPVVVAEVKCRTNESTTYPTYMLSVLKRHNVRALAQEIGAKPVLIVRFTDRILQIDLGAEPDSIEIGGRTDRGDAQDLELVCHYSISRMYPVKGVE